MRRFSVLAVMALIALAAFNIAALRFIVAIDASRWSYGGSYGREFLIGMLPLANAAWIGLGVLVARTRYTIRRRGPDERGLFVPAFTLSSIVGLVVIFAVSSVAPDILINYFQAGSKPINRLWSSIDLEENYNLIVYGIIPASLFLVISGPPLLAAYLIGRLLRGYRLTPRSDA